MSDSQLGFDLNNSDKSKPDSSVEGGTAMDGPAHQPPVYSVSDLNSMIREILEGEFKTIWLKAEISNFIKHTSGHFYFSLKDDSAQISAVMFKGLNSKLKFKPANGLEVLVRGKITVYEPRGNYQIFCEHMEPVGAGALQKAFEQLKEKLLAEGLFDVKKKRALPKYPKHIGLVTSPTGAAIRDILNVLRRRYKSAKITLAPALVQGNLAPASIVSALQLINKLQDVDVLIVGRGGGSAEDLWAFNDERVARELAVSRIPTISAVGHEIDFTIADFVADLRAPTPSAAAELVVKNADEVTERIQSFKVRLWRAWQSKIQRLCERVQSYNKRLIDPQRKLQDLQMRGDELTARLEAAALRFIDDRRRHIQFAVQKMGTPKVLVQKLSQKIYLAIVKMNGAVQKLYDFKKTKLQTAAAQLDAMSPLRVVARGYSIVESEDGTILKHAQDTQVGEKLKIKLARGALSAEVKEILTK